MPNTDTIFAFPPAQAGVKDAPPQRSAAVERSKEPKVDLDMGEASREEGFRLYGCR